MYKLLLGCLALALAGGCGGDDKDPTGDAGADGGTDGGADEAGITVMTWNLYLGTEIGPMMNPDSVFQIPGLVADAWDDVEGNDFPARVEQVADTIAAVDPHLISLQEVSLYRGQSPGDYLDGNDVVAEEVWLDYLELLEAALADRDLDYAVAVISTGVDVEMPMSTSTGVDDLRLTDRDAILVRGDVGYADEIAETFDTVYTVDVAGGTQIVIDRGWTALDATIDDVTFRFVGTHLEISGSTTSIQVAQGDELIDAFADHDGPLVVVGDLNSRANGTSTPTYGNFIDAGYTDAWVAVGNEEAGLTCCYGSFLGDPEYILSSRIDYVLSRGEVTFGEAYTVGSEVLTPDGLHPSDHLGVVATIAIP